MNTRLVSSRGRVTEPLSEDADEIDLAESGRRLSIGTLPLAAREWDAPALVAGIVAGSSVALAALFDRYAEHVRGVLVATYGGALDADDVTQETFLIVARRCSTLRDPAALQSFIVSVALRVARNEHRKRVLRRWIGLEAVSESCAAVGPHDPCGSEVVRRIHVALGALSVDARIVFVLRRVEGYELTEAAAIAGCSLATFKRRLRRAEDCFDALCRADPVLRDFVAEGRE